MSSEEADGQAWKEAAGEEPVAKSGPVQAVRVAAHEAGSAEGSAATC